MRRASSFRTCPSPVRSFSASAMSSWVSIVAVTCTMPCEGLDGGFSERTDGPPESMLAGMCVSPWRRRFLRALCPAVLALLQPAGALAHPVPFSYLDLRLRPDRLEGELVVHVEDFAYELGVQPAIGLLEPGL